MKIKQLIYGFTVLALFSVVIFACRKTKDRDDASEVAQQNSLAEITFLDFAYMGDQVAKGSQYFKTFNGDCSTLSYDTVATMVTATIDYGTTDCICNDGKKRRGQVAITYPLNYTAKGSVTTAIPTYYYVNGNLIEGKRTATIDTKDSTITNIVSTATITPEGAKGSITWNANRKREYLGNTNTSNIIAGKYYELTGTTTGTTIRGTNFSTEITDALQIQAGCRWIKEGILTISGDNFKENATVDFGDGSCDNKAKLKYGKKEVDLNL